MFVYVFGNGWRISSTFSVFKLSSSVLNCCSHSNTPTHLTNLSKATLLFVIFLCTRQISQNPYPIRVLPS
ncbi:hypothetical protein DIQ36_20920 [Acinetobacter baumannii]|nr:hypothetical protein [Acinetobacter baumannii]